MLLRRLLTRRGVHVGREGVLGGLQEEVHVLPLRRVVVGPGGLDQSLLEVGRQASLDDGAPKNKEGRGRAGTWEEGEGRGQQNNETGRDGTR